MCNVAWGLEKRLSNLLNIYSISRLQQHRKQNIEHLNAGSSVKIIFADERMVNCDCPFQFSVRILLISLQLLIISVHSYDIKIRNSRECRR